MIKIKKISLCLLTILLFSFLFIKTEAATIDFSPSTGSYNVGDTINVKVYINSSSTPVNAVSANISYSSDILSLSSISKTGSIINIWAQEPSFSNIKGTASFEGVILNGYNGSLGNMVTLVFKANKSGTANIRFDNASILANDGAGTEVLSSSGFASIKVVTPVVQKEDKTKTETITKEKTKTTKTDMAIRISEIKNTTEDFVANRFLISSPVPINNNTYTIQIDSMPSIIWTDDGTKIFQAPKLTSGNHTIKVVAEDMSSNVLSGSLNFSTIILSTPIITYYSNNLYVDDLLVVKGIADQSVDVEIRITNIDTGVVVVNNVSSNNEGKFTYVPEEEIPAGTYSIIARSISKNGLSSDYSLPIQVFSREHKLNFFAGKIEKYLSILTPTIALLALLVIVSLYSFYRIKKVNMYLKKKIQRTEEVVKKSFDILEEDFEQEIEIFKKIRENKPLNKDEQVFLEMFKKDIKETEKVIKKELEKIKK